MPIEPRNENITPVQIAAAYDILQHKLLPLLVQSPHATDQKLAVGLQTIFSSPDLIDDDVLRVAALREKLIRGTPSQMLKLSTAIFFSAYASTVLVSPAVSAMSQLDIIWLKLVANIPAATGAIATLLTGYYIEKDGGIQAIKLGRYCTTIVSAGGLITLSSFVNFSTIREPDWRFGLLLGMVSCIGTSYPASLLLPNNIAWHPTSEKSHVISIFSGIGGLGQGINLITLYYLSAVGLRNEFLIFLGVALIPGLIGMYFLRPPPLHQLKARGLSYEDARTVAILFRQDNFSSNIISWTQYFRSLKEACIDPPMLLGLVNAVLVFGVFSFYSSTGYIIFNQTLGFSLETAVLLSGVSSIVCTPVRALSGRIIERFDAAQHGSRVLNANMVLNAALLVILAVYKPTDSETAPAVICALLCLLQLSSAMGAIANARMTLGRTSHRHTSGSVTTTINTTATIATLVIYLSQVLCGYKNADHADSTFYALLAGSTVLSVLANVRLQRREHNRYQFFTPTQNPSAAVLSERPQR